MAFAHKALEQAEAGPGAWRVIGPDAPAPLRGMVARGLAPLPPRDLLVALYQIWVTNDPDLATVAAKTVEGLPPPILGGALDDPKLPAGVLDFIGRRLSRNVDALDRVVRHRNVDDETLSGLARVCPESVCDTLADNQERWMRHPAIVESLYQNPHCRMSVVHRMLELAVREGIELRLPNMDEIKAALVESTADPERDEVFKRAASSGVAETHARMVDKFQAAGSEEEIDLDGAFADNSGDLDLEGLFSSQSATDALSLPFDEDGAPEGLQAAAVAVAEQAAGGEGRFFLISKLKPMEKIRLALLGTNFERFVLIRDSNKAVCMSAIKSPKVNENEVVAYAANRTLARDVISYIAKRREWTKLYTIQLNLVLNPKTPMALAMGFLTRLHAHDVKKVAFSKNIPSALATAARRRLEQRK